MAAASAPDLGLTGAENLRGADDFFFVSVGLLVADESSGKDAALELAEGRGSAADRMMVLTWLLPFSLEADNEWTTSYVVWRGTG